MDITAQDNTQDNMNTNSPQTNSNINSATDDSNKNDVNPQNNTRYISSLLKNTNINQVTDNSQMNDQSIPRQNQNQLDGNQIKKSITHIPSSSKEGMPITYPRMETQNNQNIETIIPETQNVENKTEKIPNIEVQKTPEIETVAQEEKQQKEVEEPKPTIQAEIRDNNQALDIVDLRTGDKKTLNVNPDADDTTKKADEDEQEFIDSIEHEQHEIN